MKLFTRITATLNATAESAVARFENHEAITESALRRIRQTVSEARIRHERVVRDGQEIRRTIASLNEQIGQWTARASRSAAEDESRALACLDRRAACRAQLAHANESSAQHVVLESQTRDRLQQMQRRLEQIILQRNQLRSRESVAKATQALNSVEGSAPSAGINDLFERWEVSIGESEIHNEVHGTPPDPLMNEYETAEKRLDLQRELAELKGGQNDEN